MSQTIFYTYKPRDNIARYRGAPLSDDNTNVASLFEEEKKTIRSISYPNMFVNIAEKLNTDSLSVTDGVVTVQIVHGTYEYISDRDHVEFINKSISRKISKHPLYIRHLYGFRYRIINPSPYKTYTVGGKSKSLMFVFGQSTPFTVNPKYYRDFTFNPRLGAVCINLIFKKQEIAIPILGASTTMCHYTCNGIPISKDDTSLMMMVYYPKIDTYLLLRPHYRSSIAISCY